MLASTLFATTRCSAAFVSRGAAVRAFSRTSALAMANPTVCRFALSCVLSHGRMLTVRRTCV
jgi:hypothetical protein